MSKQDTVPSAGKLFRIWAGIGLQSFGGGAATTLLIQRTFIENYGWLSIEEFTRLWNLCLLAPGINLIAITALLGKRFGGGRGIVASLAGLLLPSATITCLLAALFVHLEQLAAVQAVLRGVVPATGGIMLLVCLNFARPLLRRGRQEGLPSVAMSAVLVSAGALAIILLGLSAIVVVLGAAALGIACFSATSPAKVYRERREAS